MTMYPRVMTMFRGLSVNAWLQSKARLVSHLFPKMHPLQARLDRYTSRLRAALAHYHQDKQQLEPYMTWYHEQAVSDLVCAI